MKSQAEKKDFSEINLAVNSGFASGPDDGGNSLMSTAYFARWGGPVSEDDDPDPTAVSEIVPRTGLTVDKHIQDVIFLADRSGFTDNDEIKSAVYNYGAVDTSIYMDTSYLNPANSAYYDNGSESQDHGVDIVGWDDSYSRNNFLTTPPGDGAFICRNSWGTNFGDNGYFYVSYYDTGIACDNYVFDDAEPINNYSKIYQYTPLGVGGGLTYGNTNWFANVYTASDESSNKQSLAAVSFYTMEEGTSYEIYAEPDYDTYGFTRITSNKLKYGTFTYAGYHTIKLDNLLGLTNNKKFAVAVKITNPNGCDIITESTDFKDSSTPVSSAGQSFINGSADGNPYYWDGIQAGDANVCLNAFTKITYSKPVTGITLNTSSLNLSPGGNYKLFSTISPSDASDQKVIYDSSDDYVASVDSTGKVTAKSAGSAVITAVSEDGSFKTVCTVNVKAYITSDMISPAAYTDVDVNSSITVNFSSNIEAFSDYNNIKLTDEDGNDIAKTLTIDNSRLIVKPDAALSQDKIYTLEIPQNAVEDYAGNTAAYDSCYRFLTTMPYNSNVTFESPWVEKQVRSQLNKQTGNITSYDMKNLSSISISDENITGLKGLEYAINLNSIYMYNCNIKDISPLKHLLNLSSLDIEKSSIQDISPVNYMDKLQNINLANNIIEDCSVLENKIKLQRLDLSYNNVSDVTPIKNMIADQDYKQDIVLSNINLNYDYLDLSDPAASAALAYIGQSIIYNNLSNQRSGLKIVYDSPDNPYMDKSVNPAVISFRDNIYQGSSFNNIQLYAAVGSSTQPVSCDVSISSNKLILRPDQKLTPGIYYTVYLPDNAAKDSDGKGNTSCRYTFMADDYSYDINKDGTTDLKDIAAVSQNYGQKVTESNFNTNIDFNKDGIIDLYDLIMESRQIN